MSDVVVIGKFGRPHGVRGEVRFFPYNPETPLLQEGVGLLIPVEPDGFDVYVIERSRRANEFHILKLEDVADRDEAAAFRHVEAAVPRELFPDIEEGDEQEFYQVDLLDFAVLGRQSEEDELREIGVVAGFLDDVATDVMVVTGDRVDGRMFVPMVENVVLDVDLESERVTIAPIDAWAPEDQELQ